jgi:hypothetical protein
MELKSLALLTYVILGRPNLTAMPQIRPLNQDIELRF